MNCRSAEPLLSAFLEDDLSQNERRNLEAHLLSCRRCSLALRELRSTLELLQSVPLVETSPHFEADLLARIRSGEGLRPSVIEWLRGYMEPARLRPIFLTGAAACAIWIAVLLVGPNGTLHGSNLSRIAAGASAPKTSLRAPSPALASSGAASEVRPGNAAGSGTVKQPGAEAVASRPSQNSKAARPTPAAAGRSSDYAWTDRDWPASKSGQDSTIPNPGSRYDDEYITDQFILERGFEGSNNRTITPVSDRPSDDVFITF